MAHVGRRPDDCSLARSTPFIPHDELPGALENEVELVLAAVYVRVLLLPRVKAVEPEHQALATKYRGLEDFRRIGADVIGEMRDVRHVNRLDALKRCEGVRPFVIMRAEV